MIKHLSKLRRNQRGQSLVELALILPILVIFLMSTLEFGRVFFTYLTITHASREAARATVVAGIKDDTFIRQKVLNTATWLDSSLLVVNASPQYYPPPAAPTRTTGVPLTVSVSYKVKLYTPVLSGIIANPFPVQAQTTMRIE